jgi:hypothetical protein
MQDAVHRQTLAVTTSGSAMATSPTRKPVSASAAPGSVRPNTTRCTAGSRSVP